MILGKRKNGPGPLDRTDLEAALPERLTDMHCHLIWGVDDGAREREETFRMLREAAADGIGRVICTPHVTPGVYEFPAETFAAHFREAEDYIRENGLGLQLYAGAEILYTDNTPRLLREKRIPTLAGSRYALIEFSPTDSLEHIREALRKVSGAGVIPVIAHMERYPAIGRLEQVREMRRGMMALVQINARSLLRKQPLLRRRFFDSLFREGLVDFVATDTHALPGRETCMREGMRAVAQNYGVEIARQIADNANCFFTECSG